MENKFNIGDRVIADDTRQVLEGIVIRNINSYMIELVALKVNSEGTKIEEGDIVEMYTITFSLDMRYNTPKFKKGDRVRPIGSDKVEFVVIDWQKDELPVQGSFKAVALTDFREPYKTESGRGKVAILTEDGHEIITA